ncbi:MAG TPA: glycosyltransferase family 87 protein [Thermoanaerobaculia bacterium]|nr:glycosyltransferase family 87 protein [Thermoanaerobaculia bacterium]
MSESVKARVAIALALTAAVVRLIPLQWLHPLNWDELEFFRATSWIAEGRVPFRDFWEHHSPLAWFVFAPFTWLTDSPGVEAVIVLRWAQIPVWIAVFWLLHAWMSNAGIERFPRWAAMSLALSSSLFMTPAIEYRVEALACALLMGGLVLAQRERYFLAGVVFCLAGFANLRLGPVLVIAVLALLVTRRLRAIAIAAGGFTALAACLGYFAATGSLAAFYQQVWVDNLAEKYALPVVGGFLHRLLVPFGVRLIATDRFFELAAFDVGGVAVLLIGFAGIFVAWRRRGDVLLLAVLQVTNLVFIGIMKFIYNYHLALTVVLMVPLIAIMIERVRRQHLVLALLVVAWSVNLFASVFRGKELDRAYQDLIMREVHARTRLGDSVWSGVTWAFDREPAYRFWFLPELTRQLVKQRLAPRYVVTDPPGAVVADFNVLRWLVTVQRELTPYFARHYIPLWRELWIPALNARIPASGTFQWTVPRDGHYRVYVSRELARHPWFHTPVRVVSYKEDDASRFTFTLPPSGPGPIRLDRDVAHLRKGDRLTAFNPANETLAVILLPTDDRTLFRQPPPGVTLEGETTRITHLPQLGVRFEP